jgi:hypothetical protein
MHAYLWRCTQIRSMDIPSLDIKSTCPPIDNYIGNWWCVYLSMNY